MPKVYPAQSIRASNPTARPLNKNKVCKPHPNPDIATSVMLQLIGQVSASMMENVENVETLDTKIHHAYFETKMATSLVLTIPKLMDTPYLQT